MTKPPISDAELDRRILLRVWLIAAAFLAAVGVVNASTLIVDAMREGRTLDPRVPWILEFSSIAVIIALVPAVALYERRFPITSENWRVGILAHLAGSLVFSGLHVAGMILLRHAAYAIVLGQGYRFFDAPFADVVYEYRKDLLPYAVIVVMLSLVRSVEEHKREAEVARAEARQTGRLTLKSGGRTILLDAASLEWAQAAANYVDIRANGITHLARISLTALEQQLSEAGVDVVRVHRSRIVNRAKVVEIAPSRDGDFRIKTIDGSELSGSRRYRRLLSS
jgi:DNA-binding LytR/AlgR family response regulator